MACYLQKKNIVFIWVELAVVICMCLEESTLGELHRFEHKVEANGALSFLVIGDWGRNGLENQSDVAFQMGKIGEKLDINFVVSTGDNFYDNGLTGIRDPTFKQSFTDVYTAKSLQKPWYSVLGNHDYRGNAMAQLNPVLRKIDPRWHCLRNFILSAGFVDMFFVDTTPLADLYFDDPQEHKYDWRGVLPRNTYLLRLLKKLESALSKSTANWKIVVGHHAIRSMGHHGDTQELIDLLLPLLKANNVDMYMNGHDHCLEQVSCPGSKIQYLTSGGGSRTWRGDVKENDYNECSPDFFYDGSGFMSAQFTSSLAKIVFYDVNGKEIHHFTTTKPVVSDM